MGYSAKAIANYFIRISKTTRDQITPLKVQKLVYFSHGWHLALHPDGLPLVDDEFIEAWQFGPVFPSLYFEFKHCGKKPIKEYAQDFNLIDIGTKNKRVEMVTPQIRNTDTIVPELLDRVWEVYKGYSAVQLSSLTHAPDTPWAITRKENPGVRNVDIPNELIREYYKNLIENRSQNEESE